MAGIEKEGVLGQDFVGKGGEMLSNARKQSKKNAKLSPGENYQGKKGVSARRDEGGQKTQKQFACKGFLGKDETTDDLKSQKKGRTNILKPTGLKKMGENMGDRV